jgi:hypothetical protein
MVVDPFTTTIAYIAVAMPMHRDCMRDGVRRSKAGFA